METLSKVLCNLDVPVRMESTEAEYQRAYLRLALNVCSCRLLRLRGRGSAVGSASSEPRRED